MAFIEYVARPVESQQWAEQYQETTNALSGVAEFYPAEALRCELLTRKQTHKLPNIRVEHFHDLDVALRALRETSAPQLEVATTKILVRNPGRILLGLVDNDALNDEKIRLSYLVRNVFGDEIICVRDLKWNINLGTMTDKSSDAYREVIHTLTDNVMPKSVVLGAVALRVAFDSSKRGAII